MIATAAPQPQAGETYEQYVARAHRELMQAIPGPEDRNRTVWDAWAAAYGDPERDRAAAKFSVDRFDCRRDVCYFSEHETARTGPDGQPVTAQAVAETQALRDHIKQSTYALPQFRQDSSHWDEYGLPYNFPCVVVAGAVECGQGTKFSALRFQMEAHRAPDGHPNAGVLWNRSVSDIEALINAA